MSKSDDLYPLSNIMPLYTSQKVVELVMIFTHYQKPNSGRVGDDLYPLSNIQFLCHLQSSAEMHCAWVYRSGPAVLVRGGCASDESPSYRASYGPWYDHRGSAEVRSRPWWPRGRTQRVGARTPVVEGWGWTQLGCPGSQTSAERKKDTCITLNCTIGLLLFIPYEETQ